MPVPWTRRRALGALGSAGAVGLAGCLGGPAGVVGTPTARSAPVDVAFTATVERSFTDDHPGRIRLTLANQDDVPFAMTVARGIEGPLSVIEGEREGGEGTLVVLTDPPEGDHETPPGAPCASGEYAIPEEPTDGCWRPACDIPRVTAHYAIPIAAGEALAWPYVVLDGVNDTCLPAGTYAFTETAPIALERGTGGTTPPGGPTHYLDKRLELHLADDGTLAADAAADPRALSGPVPTEATDPETPRPESG